MARKRLSNATLSSSGATIEGGDPCQSFSWASRRISNWSDDPATDWSDRGGHLLTCSTGFAVAASPCNRPFPPPFLASLFLPFCFSLFPTFLVLRLSPECLPWTIVELCVEVSISPGWESRKPTSCFPATRIRPSPARFHNKDRLGGELLPLLCFSPHFPPYSRHVSGPLSNCQSPSFVQLVLPVISAEASFPAR